MPLTPLERAVLDAIDKDIAEHPEKLVPLESSDIWKRAKELTEGVEVDLDSPLEDDE